MPQGKSLGVWGLPFLIVMDKVLSQVCWKPSIMGIHLQRLHTCASGSQAAL